MKQLFFLFLVCLSCKKASTKHCYECETTRAVAGQIRTLEMCGTSKEAEDFENKGYKHTISVNGNQTTEIVPLNCVQKD